jgi:hypothetical protein
MIKRSVSNKTSRIMLAQVTSEERLNFGEEEEADFSFLDAVAVQLEYQLPGAPQLQTGMALCFKSPDAFTLTAWAMEEIQDSVAGELQPVLPRPHRPRACVSPCLPVMLHPVVLLLSCLAGSTKRTSTMHSWKATQLLAWPYMQY